MGIYITIGIYAPQKKLGYSLTIEELPPKFLYISLNSTGFLGQPNGAHFPY